MIDVNLTGAFHTIEMTRHPLTERGGGAIALINSVMGLVGGGSDDSGSMGYAAAKHGMVGLIRFYTIFLGRRH